MRSMHARIQFPTDKKGRLPRDPYDAVRWEIFTDYVERSKVPHRFSKQVDRRPTGDLPHFQREIISEDGIVYYREDLVQSLSNRGKSSRKKYIGRERKLRLSRSSRKLAVSDLRKDADACDDYIRGISIYKKAVKAVAAARPLYKRVSNEHLKLARRIRRFLIGYCFLLDDFAFNPPADYYFKPTPNDFEKYFGPTIDKAIERLMRAINRSKSNCYDEFIKETLNYWESLSKIPANRRNSKAVARIPDRFFPQKPLS